eukprot:1337329-Pleurochrysis_carterae.AAC.3
MERSMSAPHLTSASLTTAAYRLCGNYSNRYTEKQTQSASGIARQRSSLSRCNRDLRNQNSTPVTSSKSTMKNNQSISCSTLTTAGWQTPDA